MDMALRLAIVAILLVVLDYGTTGGIITGHAVHKAGMLVQTAGQSANGATGRLLSR
jgi:hypothetical protein